MKTKHKMGTTGGRGRRAPLCLLAAETSLQYLHMLMCEREGIRQADDSTCVHRVRVASRRLWNVLPWLAACLPRQTYRQWRKQIRRVTRALGGARDTDVRIAFVRQCRDECSAEHERAGMARLLLRLEQQRRGLQAQVVAALDRLDAKHCAEEMEQTLHQFAAQVRSRGVDVRSPEAYRRVRKAILARLKALQAYAPYVQQPECVEELHAMRIAARRLRYTMQACAPLYQGELEEPIRVVRTLQNMLRDLHDCDVWARDLPRFLEEERVRTFEYFGHLEPFEPLVPGIQALRENRQQYRAQRYQEFVAFWQQVQEQDAWRRLHHTLAIAPQPAQHASPAHAPMEAAPDGSQAISGSNGHTPVPVREAVLELARQCQYEAEHTHHVTRLTLRLFDVLQPLHGLGAPERFWLECGALLHDIGWIKGQRRHHKAALRLILEGPLLPFDTRERLLVGAVARYHRRALPSMAHKPFAALTPADQQCVRVLAGILRVADGLDRTHQSIVQDLTCDVSPEQIVVRCLHSGDAEEEFLAARKGSTL